MQFSLSYSGNQALIAIAEVAVGADIEALPDAKSTNAWAALLHRANKR